MTQRLARKTQTRMRIVERAVKLCARSGFAGLRTAEVARAANLSHGAVFVHFPSRDDLLLEVASRIGVEIAERLHRLVARGASLREVLRAHLDALAAREDQYRHLVLEGPLLPEDFRIQWTGLQSAVAIHIEEAAGREMEAGLVRRMPMHLLFNTWVGLVHHYLVNREQFALGRSVLAERGEELLEHYLSLLQGQPKRRAR
jgi:AcrR family transcriptional regulator